MKTVLFTLLIILFGCPLFAAIPDGVDSVLYVYYRRCNDNVRNPRVFAIADTLFQLSTEKGDKRMQAASLALKVDYYYYNNNTDSLKILIQRAQEFARNNDQLKYYYFTWNRLILHYTKRAQYTLAQYEIQRLLEQAKKDNYIPATAQAYQQLGHIYRLKMLFRPSLEYYKKAVEYLEQNTEGYYSMCNIYIQLSSAYTILEEYDSAMEMLEKARAAISQPSDEWEVKLRQATLYPHIGRTADARVLMNEIDSKCTSISREQILMSWCKIYKDSHSYAEALRVIDELFAVHEKLGTSENYYYGNFNTRAEIYAAQENFQAAYNDLRKYTTIFTTQTIDDGEKSLNEFATILDVTRLDNEKNEAIQLAQAQLTSRNRSIIISLATILLLATLFIVILTRMNRHLARAKRAAEESSRMKDFFIRTITHEINTPLNAIVGFAELTATVPFEEVERNSYIKIVQENSGYLQKLVNDVLYISDIESSDNKPLLTNFDLYKSCQQAIRDVAAQCPTNVELRFSPDHPQHIICTANQYVTKVINELLRNAIRFTKEGHVELSYTLSKDKKSVTFAVTDTGIGVPAEDAEHIFGRFVKRDPFGQGLGLGLGVCRLIAETLGGEIRLDTSYCQGARFLFTIATS